jgi:hypothetical protein
MQNQMFHVFRNSPLGRENLMQAAYLCSKEFDLSLAVYIPTCARFVMPFEGGEVTVELDESYTVHPATAQVHAEQALEAFTIQHQFFTPEVFADTSLPEIPVTWAMMSCPRAISEKSSRIGLGHIGPRVRGIVKHAPFPVFIPAMAYKPWNSVAIFFGGSELGMVVVAQGIALARLAQVPFTIYTQLDGVTREECEQALARAGLLDHLNSGDADWRFFDTGSFEENLYEVPHDSLTVVGAAGQRLIEELIFGSKLEIIQATLPNAHVVVGPNRPMPADLRT